MNTKERHQEILAAAAYLIEVAGGVEAIDALTKDQHKAVFNRIVDDVIKDTACSSRQIARNNVAKALRRGRNYLMEMRTQGGARTPGPGKKQGRPNEGRVKVSTRLAPGYLDKAKAIAKAKGLAGWGRAVEMALDLMIEGDPELS